MRRLLQRAGSPSILVGHLRAAAVALRIAMERPGRVRALALYEPTLFSLIEADSPAPNEADGIRSAVYAAGLALDAGDADVAAAHFIDDWTGPGSWAATRQTRRPAIAACDPQRSPLGPCPDDRAHSAVPQGADHQRAACQRADHALPLRCDMRRDRRRGRVRWRAQKRTGSLPASRVSWTNCPLS